MDSTQTKQPIPAASRPFPSFPAAPAPSADRIREQLGWRMSQPDWHPRHWPGADPGRMLGPWKPPRPAGL